MSRGRVVRKYHIYIHCLVLIFSRYNKGTDWRSFLVISKEIAQLMEIMTRKMRLITVVDIQFVHKQQWNVFHHFFYVQHFILNILVVAGNFRNDICFLVISHPLVFRGCTKRVLTRWKHDRLFCQQEGFVEDVLPMLIFLFGLFKCIQIRTKVYIVDNKIINIKIFQSLVMLRVC